MSGGGAFPAKAHFPNENEDLQVAKWPRVLVIDDSPADVELLEYSFLKAYLYVVRARTPDDGLRLALSDKPDLIVCDRKFNGEDGYSLGRRIRAEIRLKDVPMVLLTGAPLKRGDHKKALDAGFDGCIEKTPDSKLLARQLMSFMPE